MLQPNDLSRSLVALDHNSTIVAVVELSQSSWLVGGVLPGIERQPRKKLEPRPGRLLGLLHRWRDEAVRAGHKSRGLRLPSKPAATCCAASQTRLSNPSVGRRARLCSMAQTPAWRYAAAASQGSSTLSLKYS
jgi:hypothetical protein